MLKIKLSKIGKSNKKVFRLIISEKGRDPYGRALEILGSYNPYSKELQAKKDRIQYWIEKGAGLTATVNNLLVGQGIIEGKKVKASKKGKPKKKASEEKEVKQPTTKEESKVEKKEEAAKEEKAEAEDKSEKEEKK